MRNIPTPTHQMDTPGIGPKKTFFVLMTVVGCIAILWPKVFYPMMMGGSPPKQPAIKAHHGTGLVPCCGVVLDRDEFLNVSKTLGELAYRRQIDYRVAQSRLRQERPPHLRKEGVHPAMLEKGRAIPTTQTVPVVTRPSKTPPVMVEGRPGPIPGLRPPLGAGSVHKAQPKGSSMGFIMPLYTIGIIAFFVYTIMKLLFKKPVANPPYGPARADPNFRKEVFGSDHIKRPDDGATKLGLIDAADEELKRREAARMQNKDQANDAPDSSNLTNGHAAPQSNGDAVSISPTCEESNSSIESERVETPDKSNFVQDGKDSNHHDMSSKENLTSNKSEHSQKQTVQVLGMELTASCEGGQKWNRPPTPLLQQRPLSPVEQEEEKAEPIFLEGALPKESQILVADAETTTEKVIDEALNGTPDEPAVILSSKMTLSLINLNAGEEVENPSIESDSRIAEDIEIINGAEKESSESEDAEHKKSDEDVN